MEVAGSLAQLTARQCAEVATSAGSLARREFMLADQTREFWGTVCSSVEFQ
jgi:hypothetical protein